LNVADILLRQAAGVFVPGDFVDVGEFEAAEAELFAGDTSGDGFAAGIDVDHGVARLGLLVGTVDLFAAMGHPAAADVGKPGIIEQRGIEKGCAHGKSVDSGAWACFAN
jgi:hypothetical protein